MPSIPRAISLLFTHTCPVTEFAVAPHLNTANSCCHHVFLRHFRFQKCLPVYINDISTHHFWCSCHFFSQSGPYLKYIFISVPTLMRRASSGISSRVYQPASESSSSCSRILSSPSSSAKKSDHLRISKRPRLTLEIADIFNFQPDFLHHFAADGLFKCLPNLDKSSDQRISTVSTVVDAVARHKKFVPRS